MFLRIKATWFNILPELKKIKQHFENEEKYCM